MASADADPAEEPDAAHRTRPHRWRRLALRWLPLAILVSLTAGAAGIVATLAPEPVAAGTLEGQRPTIPILSLRRDLGPFVDQVADRRLEEALARFAATQPPDTCLVVRGGGVDFSHRGDDPQVPASAQKLATAVAALRLLGPEHRYRTPVLVREAPVDGVVGDLHLRGGGDPLLATADYAARFANQPQVFTDIGALADAIVAAGVTRIRGAVLADEGRYDQVRFHPDWPPRFIAQRQTGPLSALAVNDGFVRWSPNSDRPGTPAPDPAAHAARVLADALAERGVAVDGGAGRGPVPPEAVELAAVESPPLADVVAQMLQESDNATAELVLKELGVQGLADGSAAAGAAVVREVLDGAGFDLDAAAVSDGSGLSPDNVMTCALLVDLLEDAETAPDLLAGLAVAGRSGTLARRWLGTDLVGRVAAKTGTLNQVTALVGTTLALDDEDDVRRFAIVVNVEAPAVIQFETVEAQERLVRLLTDPPGGPDLDGLRP